MAQADENLIYYNIDVKNETQERIIPSFNINRVQAVLDDPSEYEMAIVRFSLPLTSIPLFLFKNDIFKVSLKNVYKRRKPSTPERLYFYLTFFENQFNLFFLKPKLH